jgi:nitrate reductase gamma subunit
MNPSKKESAFLHLPTYTAGVLYHLGTFLSILLFFVFLTHASLSGTIAILLSGFLIITGACGIGILVKRMITKELRSLSSPDDYISNLMVSLFQLFTVLALILPEALPEYFILASCLMLYFPMGKLKHAIYFFAARYQLGLFYGRRGVWPPKTL